MKKRVFYSWQSDLPNNTNRGFINTAIEKALAEINSDDSYTLIPFLDRDTAGLTGSPDISASIFEKIDNSSVFICDVSIINSLSTGSRFTPNPNVLIELGYAISKLTWNNIILVMNEEFGSVESLPFDLRGRKVLTYSIKSESESKAPERKKVASILKGGIAAILDNIANIELSNSDIKQTQKTEEIKLTEDKEAESLISVVDSITFTTERNQSAIKFAKKYINKNRYDLAVKFALLITFTTELNQYLIHIAKESIKHKDIATAQEAIKGITFTTERNQLSMQVLRLAS
ncbi:hypothetical protein ACM9HF_02995 [Colwellia sp. RE-S-Sl-9]